MILLNQLAMTHGCKLLFNDVSLKLVGQTRYALVGANGVGKSTLLRLIAGQEEPSGGRVELPKNATLGWLKQDQYRYEEVPIADVVIQGKVPLWQALQEKEALLAADNWDEAACYRIAEVEEIISHHQGYSARSMVEKLLLGLGIDPEYFDQPLKTLSGGYKLRVLLAQTLFQAPDILLLDEPTNHLDITSIRWLERYLQDAFSGLLVFISHDLDFINHLADHILDIDYGDIQQYSGRYEKFLQEKALVTEQKIKEKKHAERKIAQLQKFVDQFGASATKARQAQSKAKMIAKIELPDILHSSRKTPHFEFTQEQPSGKRALGVESLSVAYGEHAIFQNLKFNILRGEKIAVIGENGAGKSTLIKALLDLLPRVSGEIHWGHSVKPGYFCQDHHESLKRSSTVLEWLSEEASGTPLPKVRKTLGQVLFTQEEVNKNILALSGGEAARLLLAKIMLAHSNVLFLDEPTNHLDIEATEGLAEALKRYPGTLIVVSHNRHFLSKIATRVFYLSKAQGLQDFQGSYVEFEAAWAAPDL